MQHTPHRDLVAAHLGEILRSRPFASSPRLCQFLRYVVETQLAGEGHTIKEFVVATEVYGRDVTYDPQVDSTVRVEASRLRAKLREYYRTDGASADVEIELPKGSYAPMFHFRAHLPAAAERTRLTTAPRMYALASLATALVAGVFIWHSAGSVSASSPPADAVETFIQAQKLLRTPVLNSGWPGGVPATVEQSIGLFEQVTRRAPRFARAWVGLAEAHEWAYELDKSQPKWRLEKAKAALRSALRADSKLGEAYSRLSSIHFHRENDATQAEVAVRQAIALNPHDTASQARYIDLLRVAGRSRDALSVSSSAVSAEPASHRLWGQRAVVLYDLDRYAESIDAADHALKLSGGARDARALWAKGMSFERLGRLGEAEEMYRLGIKAGSDWWNLPSLGHLLGRTGRRDEALQILAELRQQQESGKPFCFQIALVHTGLGEYEKAAEWLQRGRVNRDSSMPFVALEKRFEPLRANLRNDEYASRLPRNEVTAAPRVY